MTNTLYIYKYKSKAHRKTYLADILTHNLTERGTVSNSQEEILVVKARAYAFSQKETEEDVHGIMNLNGAIDTLLEKSVEEEWARRSTDSHNI